MVLGPHGSFLRAHPSLILSALGIACTAISSAAALLPQCKIVGIFILLALFQIALPEGRNAIMRAPKAGERETVEPIVAQ